MVSGRRTGDSRPRPPHPALLPAVVVLLTAAMLAMTILPPTAGAATAPAVLSIAPAAFSPNADGVKDRTVATVRLRTPARLFVGVYSPAGKLLRTLQAWRACGAGRRVYRWDGRVGGKLAANARYTIRARMKVGSRTTTLKKAVTLDTVAPWVHVVEGGGTRVFGAAASSFSYQVEREAPAVLELRVHTLESTGGGALVARVRAARPAAAGSISWSGKGSDGKYLANGQYAVAFRALDAAGNARLSRREPITVWQPRSVDGSVHTAAGTAVGGALITVQGSSVKATSASNGSFHLPVCPMGFRVFTATKTGAPTASLRAKINADPVSVDLVLGQTVGGAPTAAGAAPRDTTVTISGSMCYLARDGVTRLPMRNVRVVLQDDAVTFWDDLHESSTDENGNFSFTYDYEDEWELFGTVDVRVIACAQDGAKDVCGVYWDEITPWPYEFVATQTWDNNTSDHTGLDCVKSDDERVAWFILDCIQRAHDRWQQLTNWSRGSVDVVYPEDLGGKTGQYAWLTDSIDLDGEGDDEDEWNPTTSYHEYGHALHHDAYDIIGSNIFEAYSDSTRLHNTWVPARNRWYTYQGGGDYTSEGESNAWVAFKEGFAEYFAAFNHECDQGALEHTLERDVDHAGVDDARCLHSVARVLWDLTDDASSNLYSSWNAIGMDTSACGPVPRLAGLYGSGDDDRMRGWGSAPYGSVFSKLWTVLRNDWPASLRDLRDRLFARYGNSSLNRRGVNAILYRMGIDAADISENRPHVDAGTVLVEGPRLADDAYRGTLKLWCRVTDPDSPGGDRDLDHLSVRFEGQYELAGGQLSQWAPVGWTLTRSSAPPPGQSGEGWFAVDWDTRVQSPVELAPCPGSLYGFELNTQREATMITATTTGGTARRDVYRVRAIACDDLAESDPVVSADFAVDNGPRVASAYAVAPTIAAAVRWPAGAGSGEPNATYELWYRPDPNAWGTIAAITYAYPDAPAFSGGRWWAMDLGVSMFGTVSFSLNEAGAEPGAGLAHTISSVAALQPGRWYHIAVQHGAGGMKLFIDGRLEASDAYTGAPQPDAGSPSDGAFSLGQFGDWPANSALGAYDELHVSATQRHVSSFTPSTVPGTADASTRILDHLDGTTGGINDANASGHPFTFVVLP